MVTVSPENVVCSLEKFGYVERRARAEYKDIEGGESCRSGTCGGVSPASAEARQAGRYGLGSTGYSHACARIDNGYGIPCPHCRGLMKFHAERALVLWEHGRRRRVRGGMRGQHGRCADGLARLCLLLKRRRVGRPTREGGAIGRRRG